MLNISNFIEEALNPKITRELYSEENYGDKFLDNPANLTPDKEYTFKDNSKIINSENDGGKFPHDFYSGPEELSHKN